MTERRGSLGVAAVALVAFALPSAAFAAVDLQPGRWFRISDPAITESSGVVTGRTNPTVLWTHNDSGDEARLFALDTATGDTLATLRLGVDARDWEDVAAGPGPTGEPSLFVGDIGDNNAEHATISVHVVPEPDLAAVASGATVDAATSVTYRFVYEDGPQDAETLLVDPATGRIAVVTKDLSGRSRVYLAPASPDLAEVSTLTFAATARFTIPETPSDNAGPIGRLGYYLATGGDISPDGSRVVIRSYGEAREWLIPDGDLAAAFDTDPVATPLPDRPQGEAITYTADRSWLVTSTEGRDAVVDLARAAEIAPPPAPTDVPTDVPADPTADPDAPAAPRPSPRATADATSDPTRAIVTVALAALAILALGIVLARRPR